MRTASRKILRFDRFTLDSGSASLRCGEREIDLRPRAFEVLRCLAENPGRVLTKEELIRAVWADVFVTDDSLVQCIREIRMALDDQSQRLIKTMPRRGYLFTPAVSDADVDSSSRAADNRNDMPASPVIAPRRQGRAALSQHLPRWAKALFAAVVLGALMLGGWRQWMQDGSRRIPSSAAPSLSIVVLPFVNLSDDAAQEYFAEGLTDDLTTDLSRIGDLVVIGRNTAFTYKGNSIDVKQVARELGVRYLLEGSVRRADNRVRIHAQLVEGESGAELWAEHFDSDRVNLLDVQDQITGRIARALDLRLRDAESRRIESDRTHDPNAADLTMRGWAAIYRHASPEQYDQALRLFEQALQIDQQTAGALVGIAWVYANAYLARWPDASIEHLKIAEDDVDRAIAIDRTNAVAHHVKGWILRGRKKTAAALEEFEAAISHNRNLPNSYAQIGLLKIESGRPEETLPFIEKAIQLSPRDPNLGFWFAFAGLAQFHMGNPAEAIRWLEKSRRTGLAVRNPLAYLVSAYAEAGKIRDAQTALAELYRLFPGATISRLKGDEFSDDPGFLAGRERMYAGLRALGMPD